MHGFKHVNYAVYILKNKLPSFPRDCNSNFFSLSDSADASVKIQRTFNYTKAHGTHHTKNNNCNRKLQQ